MHDLLSGQDQFPPAWRRLPDRPALAAERGRNWSLLALLFLLACPEPVRAVQPHGEPEGLVAHQLGHLLFAGGMLFLLARSWLSRWSGPGWYRFKGFLWLAVAWNILTFIGHLLHAATDKKELLTVDGRTTALIADSFSDLLFYFAKLDHLLLLPALVLLALALKQWMQASEGR